VNGSVVCVGLATLDSIWAVPHYPEPDGRVVASRHAVAGGGGAATASVTLSRLGIPAAFVGVVGDDAAGATIRAGLQAEGVDVSELAVVCGARSPQSSILVRGGTRAIVTLPGSASLRLSARAVSLCRAADWVHVDHVGYAAAPAGVRLSIDGGNAIEGLRLEGVGLYAPTEASLQAHFRSAKDALAAGAELVVVTRGAGGSAAYTSAGEVVEAPAATVEVVSTLGAGDVFHGALLAQLVRGRPLAEALATANLVAALSCRALDGRSAIPNEEELRKCHTASQ
jgi:sulfofructose kinase